MLKHCIKDEGIRIMKMWNFTENEDTNDMQIVVVKLDMYSFKQTNNLFERYKMCQRHREPNESFRLFVTALRDTINKRKFCKKWEESVFRDHITFGSETIDE